MDEGGSSEEGEVVAGIEAVPERTEHEDQHRAATPLIDNVAQPQRCHLVPAVKQNLQTRGELHTHRHADIQTDTDTQTRRHRDRTILHHQFSLCQISCRLAKLLRRYGDYTVFHNWR